MTKANTGRAAAARRRANSPPQVGHKAWAGRMSEPTDQLVDAFSSSLPVDRRLAFHDLQGSIAHCRMLGRQRIIKPREAARIVKALAEIRGELLAGRMALAASDEDIHMAIERRLIEKLGPLGGKLHTARSRNDQVATSFRLYLKDAITLLNAEQRGLQEALRELANRHLGVIMPGYTHLQPAQPVLFAHHLLAYVEMLQRDRERFAACYAHVDVLPLGSGALAGTTFPIDRAFVARELGFSEVSANSLDAVSDRDFALEFLAAAALLGMHLSRLAEEIVLWASQEFGFIELPDRFATGSSMMPQKKNPDVAELVRGKTGRLYGNLMALLTVMKGLPLSYNRDLQEDKEAVFDSFDTLSGSLKIFTAMVPHLQINAERMQRAAQAGFTLATELADYLVTKGVPFRDAHGVVGAVVRHCLESGQTLEQLEVAELRRFAPEFAPDVRRWLTLAAAVDRRRARGGTSMRNVRRELNKKRP
ncbi:MAG: argininosuccinate lyase [Deltaproteobacteria bacterium]|nr:argininosuccinate lyase [Deltaproteobacteria bacterium]